MMPPDKASALFPAIPHPLPSTRFLSGANACHKQPWNANQADLRQAQALDAPSVVMAFPLMLLDEGQAKVLAEIRRLSAFDIACRAKATLTVM
ncbi:MAG: hypothetical protein PVF70_09535 [Anaerolineales bacterium]|jgi:hypothetical protein